MRRADRATSVLRVTRAFHLHVLLLKRMRNSDFVGNSERFNEGYVPPKELPLDPELGGSHHGRGGTFVPTVEATDSWIWREWMDVEPGGEAVDLEDLAGELGSGAGKDVWLAGATLEGG